MSDISQIKEALIRAIEKKNNKQDDELRAKLMSTVGADLVSTLTPLLTEMAKNNVSLTEELKSAIKELKIQIPEINPTIDVNVPDIIVPDIHVPEPKVTVNIPKIDVADIVSKIQMPTEMDIKGWVKLQGVDLQNPLPVQLRDKDGKPVNLLENLTTLISSSNGGGSKIVKVSDIGASAWAGVMNADGRLRVETNDSGGTTQEVRQVSGAVDSVVVNDVLVSVGVNQVSGATWSVSVNDIFRTTVASNLINSDDRIRVSVETGGSGLTDAELRAAHLDVQQLSGAINSANIMQVGGNAVVVGAGWQDNALRVVHASDAITSVNVVNANTLDVQLVSGSVSSVNILQLGGVAISLNTGARDAGTQRVTVATDDVVPVTVAATLGVNQVSGAIWSVSAIQLTDPWTVSITGSTATVAVIGEIVSDGADTGNAPIKIGGIARTANPTAVAAGDRVSATFDKTGRQLSRPVQVRELIQTAYISIATGTETTLLAGSAGVFFDLIYAMATNNSDAAVTVDLRSATTAGIVSSIRVPANGTAGLALSVPIPQDVAADTWTADIPDITGTTVTISAIFSKEV